VIDKREPDMIDAVTGQLLEDYFREHVLDRLGVTDTSYILRDEARPRLAIRHHASGGWLPVARRYSESDASGALCGPVADCFLPQRTYLMFLPTLLAGRRHADPQVLQPEHVAELGRNHVRELNVGTLPAIRSNFTNDVEFFPGTIKKTGPRWLDQH
jgi:methyl acetate hydrolase